MSEPDAPDPPAPVAPPAGPLTDLILARLLVAKSSVPPKKLRADLAAFFSRRPSAESVAGALAGLRDAGLVEPKGQQATDAGRAQARAYLGVGKLPPRATWGTVRVKFLVPMALGFDPNSDDGRAAADPKALGPLLIRRKFGLPARTRLTLPAVLDALACKVAGFPEATTPAELRAAAASRHLGADPPLTPGQLAVDGERLLLGSRGRGAAALRLLALSGMADRGRATAPLDLPAFAAAVAAARTCPTGWFGGNKVFIAHAWRQLRADPRFAAIGLDGFKARLVEANRSDLLTLSRADLVQLMDPADVAASETRYLNAVFHFILAERE